MGSEIAMYGFPKEKLSDSPGLQFFSFFFFVSLCFLVKNILGPSQAIYSRPTIIFKWKIVVSLHLKSTKVNDGIRSLTSRISSLDHSFNYQLKHTIMIS